MAPLRATWPTLPAWAERDTLTGDFCAGGGDERAFFPILEWCNLSVFAPIWSVSTVFAGTSLSQARINNEPAKRSLAIVPSADRNQFEHPREHR